MAAWGAGGVGAGGTLCACLDDLIERGADKSNIRVLSIVTCPVGVQQSPSANRFMQQGSARNPS